MCDPKLLILLELQVIEKNSINANQIQTSITTYIPTQSFVSENFHAYLFYKGSYLIGLKNCNEYNLELLVNLMVIVTNLAKLKSQA